MNMLLLDKEDFISQELVSVSGRRFTRLKEFIHIECGKQIKSGVRNESCGSAEVIEIASDHVKLNYRPESAPPPAPPLTLVIALQRPQTFSKVIHSAVTLGIKQIHFIHTFKVEKSYWQSSMLRPEELDLEIRLALEQCGDTIYPEFKYYQRFKPFAEDILPLLVQESALAVFGHPRAEMPLPPPPEQGKILLAVGPEGGFTDYENALLAAAGLLPVTLGCRVLRTEFALAALLAKLS